MDEEIFTFINGFSGQFSILDGVMIFLSKWLMYILIALLIVVLIASKKRMYALVGIVSLLLGMGIKELITVFYVRARPFMEHDIVLLIEKEPSASFPSITTLIAFVVSTAFWYINRKVGWIFYIFATLIAISRIFVGHHYPSDVLVGSIIGVLVTVICIKIYERYLMKKGMEELDG